MKIKTEQVPTGAHYILRLLIYPNIFKEDSALVYQIPFLQHFSDAFLFEGNVVGHLHLKIDKSIRRRRTLGKHRTFFLFLLLGSTGRGEEGADDVGDIVAVEGSDAGEGRNASFPAQVGA